jgi:hypothetical protein
MNFSQLFVIINISLIVSILNVLQVIIGYARTLPGQVYLATGHYYLDYFIYLQSIAQGIRGHLLFANQFASDDPSKTFFVWWPYLIIGRIAGFLHLSPVTAYWLAVFVLTFICVILIYILISKLLEKESFNTKVITLIISLFSSAFLYFYHDKGSLHALPIDFWYAPSSLFKRLEVVPHHLLGNILILMTIITSGNILRKLKQLSKSELIRSFVILGLLFLITMTFYPYQTINLIIALLLTIIVLDFRSLKNWIFGGLLFILFGLAGISIKLLSSRSGLINRLNQSDINLSFYPSLKNILQTAGPIILLAIIGIRDFLKKMSPVKLIFINFILISWVLTFSPFASYVNNFNLRFLTPLSSIFLAALGMLGIKKIPNRIARSVITIILLIYFGFVSFLSFQLLLNDRNLFSPITYLPKGLIKGFEFLDTRPDSQVILTSPSQFLGTVLPVFADRKVYIARHVFTPDYLNKAYLADQFYLGNLKPSDADNFINKNNIGYVVLTSIEGYSAIVLKQYKFLMEVYKNNDIIIYKTISPSGRL